MLYPPNKVN